MDTIASLNPFSSLLNLLHSLVMPFAADDEEEEEDEEVEDDDQEDTDDDDSDDDDSEDDESDDEESDDDDDGDDDEDDDYGDEDDADDLENPFDAGKNPKQHKAFEKMREKIKSERMGKAEMQQLVAQTVAQTLVDAGIVKNKGKSKEEDVIELTEEERKVVDARLRELGIDPDTYKQNLRNQQAQQAIDSACDELEEEFKKSSVPFDRKKVVNFARKNKYGIAMPDAPLKDVLRIAYRHMNEGKISSSKKDVSKKKKKSKTPISSTSTSSSPAKQTTRKSAADYINSAKSRVGKQ